MNHLPSELIGVISSFLSIYEKKQLRLVSYYFYKYVPIKFIPKIDATELKESFSKYKEIHLTINEYLLDKKLNLKEPTSDIRAILVSNTLSSLKKISYNHIKHLDVELFSPHKSYFPELFSFWSTQPSDISNISPKLRHLCMRKMSNLPKLENLVTLITDEDIIFDLNELTPNLKHLVCGSVLVNAIPKGVEFLNCNNNLDQTVLDRLPNLEFLQCKSLSLGEKNNSKLKFLIVAASTRDLEIYKEMFEFLPSLEKILLSIPLFSVDRNGFSPSKEDYYLDEHPKIDITGVTKETIQVLQEDLEELRKLSLEDLEKGYLERNLLVLNFLNMKRFESTDYDHLTDLAIYIKKYTHLLNLEEISKIIGWELPYLTIDPEQSEDAVVAQHDALLCYIFRLLDKERMFDALIFFESYHRFGVCRFSAGAIGPLGTVAVNFELDNIAKEYIGVATDYEFKKDYSLIERMTYQMLNDLDNLEDKRKFFRFSLIEHIFRGLYNDSFFYFDWNYNIIDIVMKCALNIDRKILLNPNFQSYCLVGEKNKAMFEYFRKK